MGTMSHRTFMRNDPMIDDPEAEHDQIIGERLEQAILASIEQQAVAGRSRRPTSLASWRWS
jgi:hypothetical protein